MDTVRVLTLILLYALFCSAEFSDGIQEYERQCLGEDKFLCMNGECVNRTEHCDGKMDCADSTDEHNCPDEIINSARNGCNDTTDFVCSDGSKCISRTWVCNGAADCVDGSDESQCTEIPYGAVTPGCSGFKCGDKCISLYWLCDGKYDCDDHSDEDIENACRHSLYPHNAKSRMKCDDFLLRTKNFYNCLDYSYCLPDYRICDGIVDCRDGSDEADFCKHWETICDKHECPVNETTCKPEFSGYSCQCKDPLLNVYNVGTNTCEPRDPCAEDRPVCSQICVNTPSTYRCVCDEGYNIDIQEKSHCLTNDSDGLMFYSTLDSIGYINMKSKNNEIIFSGIKVVNSLAAYGKYLYWMETASGHQGLFRKNLEDTNDSKETVLSIGLEEPTDIAIDYFGKNIYICDQKMSTIYACTLDSLWCLRIETKASSPKRIVLDYKRGNMYWADHFESPVIMSARMDGSEPNYLVAYLNNFVTSMALDAPNGRLYYVDHEIHVVRLDNKKRYTLLKENKYQPGSIAVFENTLYFSDLLTNTIVTMNKMSPTARDMFFAYKTPIRHLSVYHDVLHAGRNNPCAVKPCLYFCFPISSARYKCACPPNMNLMGNDCKLKPNYWPKYLIVASGNVFNRIAYEEVANAESYSSTFNIARVQAMTYDSIRDMLYVYDGQSRTINQIKMLNFKVGLTDTIIQQNLKNVVDIHFDPVSDNLYILDAGNSLMEVFSLRSRKRGVIYHFRNYEIPLSFCLLPDYGKMLVALKELEEYDDIHLDFFGMDGMDREHFMTKDFKGPIVRVRYQLEKSMIYITDEGTNIIESVDPSGEQRETVLESITSIYSIAVTEHNVFWTDERTQRLFWSDINLALSTVRRIEIATSTPGHPLMLAIASRPDTSQPYFTDHPCHSREHIACSDICVQKSHHPYDKTMEHVTLEYQCICRPNYVLKGKDCVKLAVCAEDELFCDVSNTCSKKGGARCNGNKDCPDGEDELDCGPNVTSERKCPENKKLCLRECVDIAVNCSQITEKPYIPYINKSCVAGKFLCKNHMLCMERSSLCDGVKDCPDGYDESPEACQHPSCFETEFMCTSGNCILKTWRCDGEIDCSDGSDEMNCKAFSCTKGFFMCNSGECIEMRKRCNAIVDCIDESDEFDCIETVSDAPKDKIAECTTSEFNCELNSSICIPRTARCNGVADCPGGTDENGCDRFCESKGMFNCKPLSVCIPKSKVCDIFPDCVNAYDESEEACSSLKKTELDKTVITPSYFRPVFCPDRYFCRNGNQCIDWINVCDNVQHCDDGSDEGGNCKEACLNHNCPHVCQPKPYAGYKCLCHPGYQLTGSGGTCTDIDECARDICSQECINYPGSFLCVCNPGYALRYDRRTCKAVKGGMSILYVRGHSVQSVSSDGYTSILYNDPNIIYISDIDYDVRKGKLYIVSVLSNNLVQVNKNGLTRTFRVGQPTKVAVDWETGNTYFVDTSNDINILRVCHMDKKKCANLAISVPGDAIISALVVDPAESRLFFCLTRHLESVLWSSYLSGEMAKDFSTISNCTALAVNSYKRLLYVAEDGPAHVLEMTYSGEVRRVLYSGDPHFQSPQSIAIFEDHLYVLVGAQKLIRCMLFESKHCQPYLYRTFNANKFVINHESVQRNNYDVCEDFECTNICATKERKPRCVCDDGSIASDGQCKNTLLKIHIFHDHLDTTEKTRKTEGPELNRVHERPTIFNQPESKSVVLTVAIISVIVIILIFGTHFRHTIYDLAIGQNNPSGFRSRSVSREEDRESLSFELPAPSSVRRGDVEMKFIHTRSRNSSTPSIHITDTESDVTRREASPILNNE